MRGPKECHRVQGKTSDVGVTFFQVEKLTDEIADLQADMKDLLSLLSVNRKNQQFQTGMVQTQRLCGKLVTFGESKKLNLSNFLVFWYLCLAATKLCSAGCPGCPCSIFLAGCRSRR